MNPNVNKRIVVIVGPTASGKSAFAVRLAKKMDGEVISADSRQVYKGLNLASGKITKKEMSGVPHHCLDLVSPKTVFTAERYAKCARRAIKDILGRGKTPIVVGGTGFYIDIALGRMGTVKVAPDWKLRRKLENRSAKVLLKMLKKLAPARAKTVEPENKRRLIRAIEVAKSAKTPHKSKKINTPVSAKDGHSSRGLSPEGSDSGVNWGKENVVWLGIKTNPKDLRKKINARLASRLRAGMIGEIKKLRLEGVGWKRLDDLGLEPRWISKYLRVHISKDEMVLKLKTAIWRYSHRQMTWFKRNKEIHWISTNNALIKNIPTNWSM